MGEQEAQDRLAGQGITLVEGDIPLLLSNIRGDLERLADDDSNTLLLEKMALKEAMNKLDSREREVILRRFFKDETQTTIADDLGVSQVQVSRIEKGALLKLKGLLA